MWPAYLHPSVLPFVHHNVKSLSLIPAPSLNLHQSWPGAQTFTSPVKMFCWMQHWHPR